MNIITKSKRALGVQLMAIAARKQKSCGSERLCGLLDARTPRSSDGLVCSVYPCLWHFGCEEPRKVTTNRKVTKSPLTSLPLVRFPSALGLRLALNCCSTAQMAFGGSSATFILLSSDDNKVLRQDRFELSDSRVNVKALSDFYKIENVKLGLSKDSLLVPVINEQGLTTSAIQPGGTLYVKGDKKTSPQGDLGACVCSLFPYCTRTSTRFLCPYCQCLSLLGEQSQPV